MSPAFLLRTIRREMRGGGARLAFFTACLAVGVAAVTMVAGLTEGLDAGIREEARSLLGADVSVESRRPLAPELEQILDAERAAGRSVRRTDLRTMPSVVAAPPDDRGLPGPSRLVELRIFDGPYPFYGSLDLDPPRPLTELTGEDGVVVDPAILRDLDIAIGDPVLVGGRRFTVRGVVRQEPDRLNFTFSLGPRVYLAREGAARTNLLAFGSRVRNAALLQLPGPTTAADARALAERIRASIPDPEFHEVESFEEAQPALRAGLQRMGRFLGLVGLVSLLVGGLGIAQAVRAWINGRLDAIAVMRCLGLTPAAATMLFLVQVAALALLGSLLGAAAGAGLQLLVPVLTEDTVPARLLDPLRPAPLARGLVLGTATAIAFAAGPLLAIRRIPPAHVLRRTEPPRPRLVERLGGLAVIAGTVFAAAVWQTASVVDAGRFTGALAAASLVLGLSARGIIVTAARLRRRIAPRAVLVPLRHGLAALAAPGAATGGAVIALGIGMLLVFSVLAVESRLRAAFLEEMPGDAPSTFMVDVQPDQWEPLRTLLEDRGAEDVRSMPFVAARLRAIDGEPVDRIVERIEAGTDDRNRRRWIFTREQRLSFGPQLPEDNRVLRSAIPDGRPWGLPDRAEVSVESGIARDLGVDVGSTLTLDVQGVPVDLLVSSIRSVEWRSFSINFFLHVEPGVLEDAPHVRVATARIPAGSEAAMQDAVAAAHPNVTVVQVRAILERVIGLLGRLADGVRLLGLFTVTAGVIILVGAIAAGYARRGREVAVLRTLGMTGRQIVVSMATEYALVGIVAALVGVAGGWAVAATVVRRGLELDFPAPAGLAAAALLAAIGLTAIAGLLASIRPLASRPSAVLRSE